MVEVYVELLADFVDEDWREIILLMSLHDSDEDVPISILPSAAAHSSRRSRRLTQRPS